LQPKLPRPSIFLVAVIGTAAGDGGNLTAVRVETAFIGLYIFFFASKRGPGASVVIGEIFPLPVRACGIALSTASNSLWNCIIAVVTPYMVNPGQGICKARCSSCGAVWVPGVLFMRIYSSVRRRA
jgi:hypothetical protein